MVTASPVPLIIAGATMRARHKIAAHFFVYHAISADDAVPYVPDHPIVRRQFEKMRDKDVIRQAEAGRYWIDTAAYQGEIDARRRVLVPVVIVLCLVAALAIMLAGYRG